MWAEAKRNLKDRIVLAVLSEFAAFKKVNVLCSLHVLRKQKDGNFKSLDSRDYFF
jgi:hypothetical protein